MGIITAIIYDLDGTLYASKEFADDVHNASVEALAQQMGTDGPEAARRIAAVKAALRQRTGRESTISAACLELGCDLKELHACLAAQVHPERHLRRDDRVVAMLERLGADFSQYIYTNNNRSTADRIMDLIGVNGLFAGVFSIEDFWRAKPDRLALAKVYAAIGTEPVECLFVGDRYDVDLRLPEEHGSRVFLTHSVDELLGLEQFCTKGDLDYV